MIVREREEHFVMIEQHQHGHLARDIMAHWKKELFPGLKWRERVLTAIENHDIGWRAFDRQPFFHDKKSAPFRFTDFPSLPKLILYKQGIDQVEKIDTYAAMLCSNHYEQFINGNDEPKAQQFIAEEHSRRKELSKQVEGFDWQLFEQHYALLQLGDNFSLYCCINEPDADKANEHLFFRNGIPSPNVLSGLPNGRFGIHFVDSRTIKVKDFPFTDSFTVQIIQKVVSKKEIAENGLQSAYDHSANETVTLHFSCK
ncbi:DUF3891 family protein [Sporosarcina sp.]|uniref:DUF3891 family protein n=1 Tax=Sporosarcina sp. TaxID=49982 RepID=UPI00262584FF|nr:DUF3891 family protein [Sporosarcina sp.]